MFILLLATTRLHISIKMRIEVTSVLLTLRTEAKTLLLPMDSVGPKISRIHTPPPKRRWMFKDGLPVQLLKMQIVNKNYIFNWKIS